MSGHSKWSQIKRQKGVADNRRSGLFTKLSKAISVAARDGKDPSGNVRLRLAIEQARSANMPNENIDRAIKRGAGELEGQSIEEMTYEAYGPSGVALVIRALTDNKNRTSSALRSILARHHGSLGQTNSVLWLFQLKGMLRFPGEQLDSGSRDRLTLAAIDAGAEDIIDDPEGVSATCAPAALNQVQSQLAGQGFATAIATLELVAAAPISIDSSAQTALHALIEELEDLDDVDAVFTNAAG